MHRDAPTAALNERRLEHNNAGGGLILHFHDNALGHGRPSNAGERDHDEIITPILPANGVEFSR